MQQPNITRPNVRQYLSVEALRNRALKRAASLQQPKVGAASSNSYPPKCSLRGKVPEIYDQGQLGSCTANAFCAAYRLLCRDEMFRPSRLWVYFYERLMEDPEHKIEDLTDSGADVADGMKFVQQYGVCSENLWEYDISKYNVHPPKVCKDDALKHKIKEYRQITPDKIKHFINAGIPVLLAISVYQSFEDSVDGQVPMPDTENEQLLGGHELTIVGYSDDTQTFEVQNSWGPTWASGGFCYIPYEYIHDPNLCSELMIFKLY